MPDADTQVLRNLLRPRKQPVRERSSHVQRLQKTLEDANISLISVVTDIIGMTGRAMLAALIDGVSHPESRLRSLIPASKRHRLNYARRCAAGS